MEPVQEASLYFFGPLVAAYVAAIAGWVLITGASPRAWPQPVVLHTDRKWLDLLLVFIGAGGVAAISAMHRYKLLLPEPAGWWGVLAWNVNIILIFSPVLLIPLLRRQTFETIYLSTRKMGTKVVIGVVLGLVSVVVFYSLRGQPSELSNWAARVVDVRLLAKYFLPVFFEGVAIAFMLVRVKCAIGIWPAVLIPSILFSLGHVPNSINAGETWNYIVTFSALNTALVASILFVLQKSQDVIWLAIPHYVMDIAIRAF